MKHFLTIVAVFIACNVYAQEGRLDTDKTIRKGVLPNGMTYYIRHNSQTKGVADFYIAQKVGPYSKNHASADWHTFWNTWHSTARATSPATPFVRES